jgi:hypothetical protein
MFSVLLAHIIITLSCAWCGHLLYALSGNKRSDKPVSFYLFTGLIFLTLISQIVVLFAPVSLSVQLTIGLAVLLSMILKAKDATWLFKKIQAEFFNLNLFSSILFFACWIMIALISAGPVMMDDTESYHIQSIKWIQEYGTVPGLVNLHERFGFNSSWFSSVAVFGFAPGTTGGYTVLNSVVSAWFCFWLIGKSNQLFKENNSSSSFALLMMLVCSLAIWPMTRGNAATTNYDFITTVIVFILFTETFFTKQDHQPGIEWLLWPVYLFTVRIINFPLLILSVAALIVFTRQKKISTIILPIACCLLLAIPFIARNIIIGGYPFYPAMYFDWFAVDWKPDPAQTEKLLEYIKYYNRVPTTFQEIEQTKALGSAWIPEWFSHLFLFDKIMVIAGVAGLISMFAKKLTGRVLLFLLVLIAWLAGWFIISPDPRFVYGALLTGSLILINFILSFLKSKKGLSSLFNGVTILITAVISFYAISKPVKQNEYRSWVLPAILPQPATNQVQIDKIVFNIPESINNNWNARCYGTDLPCLYKIEQGLKLRGEKISDGFRLEK